MRTLIALLVTVVLAGALPAQGIDRIVDATGAGGAYTTITGAMLASNPGDRILVMPGSYTVFQFSRGVHLVGMGSDPSEVVIGRIAYHPSIPAQNFDTLISNVTVTSSNPLDVLSIHGNELAPGVLTIDSSVLQGGVYLRGGQQGFYLHVTNSRIEPPPGFGFSGEACRVGGPGSFVEIRNTMITGWDASASAFAPAGHALSLEGGSSVRINGCDVRGGNGTDAGLYAAGADAVTSVGPGTVQLRIDGNSFVQGGDAFGAAPGGHGVAMAGTVEVGPAAVHGGAGVPPGQPWVVTGQSVPLQNDVSLEATPDLVYAQGPVAVTSGRTMTLTVGDGQGTGALALAFNTRLPDGSVFFTLPWESLVILDDVTLTATVPSVPGGGSGHMVYAQGALIDPVTGALTLSNTAALRVDLF